ncbi:hypothetical protein HMPREF3224_02538 [Anaerococcus hydrogenalis]|nr:hypothetical protein HMPREF3224_02538 [Anaerococcus hydrogenalis]
MRILRSFKQVGQAETDKQTGGETGIDKPAHIIKMNQAGFQFPIHPVHIKVVPHVGERERQSVNNRQAEVHCIAAAEKADHSVQKRIDNNDQREAAFRCKHERFKLPISELKFFARFPRCQTRSHDH